MQVTPIKTHKIQYGDLLSDVLDAYILDLQENCIIALTSKIISVLEGRIIDKQGIDKYALIRQEADLLLKTDQNPYNIYLTIKDGILIPSAGIDESNVDDVYVLYPSNAWETTHEIWKNLRAKHGVKNLGVIITDSHTSIMRGGVTGIALGWCGFDPLYSYIGKPDIYGHPLKSTQINIADSLAVSAVFVMGEGNEQTPLALITQIPHITFLNHPPSKEDKENMVIHPEKDLYAPLLGSVKWEKTN